MGSSAWFWTAAATAAAAVWFITRGRVAAGPDPGVETVGESNVGLEDGPPPRGAGPAARAEAGGAGHPEPLDRNPPVDIGAEWENNDRARRALEERQAQQAAEDGGDANRVNAWKQKGVVGTKKARSLARRDQRRAYFEYVRQQAEDERRRLEIEEQMFGDLVAEEKEEREKRIAEARQALDAANRERREREKAERQARSQRRDEIVRSLKSTGVASLSSDLDIDIADDISGAIVLESGEYAVSVTDKLVDKLVADLRADGTLSVQAVQGRLTEML